MSSVTGKALIGFAQLFVVLAIILFGPAWTLDFTQAWVYLFVFMGSAALISTYIWKNDPKLLERRVAAGPTAEKRRSQQIIQLISAIGFIGLFIVPSLDHRFAWSHVPMYVEIVGDLLVALGFFIVFLVFKENTFAAATIQVAADQKVISTGLYAIVRHPMYAGALILLFGTPIALGSWWGLLLLVPLTLAITWRLLDEEQFLSKNLDGYTAYRQRVRYRLIPVLW